MHPALKTMTMMLTGIGLMAGTVGCYVPGGGWTLRSGIDWRIGHKPAAFVEMVDTKWDEWNRVSQMNMAGIPVAPTVIEPIPTVVPTPESEPILAPAAATTKSESRAEKTDSPADTPPGPMSRGASAPSREATPAPSVPAVEEVPSPPGNSSALRFRDRFRRSQSVAFQPRNTRTDLLPAAAARTPRISEPVQEQEIEDRGPVTFDVPESLPQPPATNSQEATNSREKETEASDYRRLVAPAATPAGNSRKPAATGTRPSVRANRPAPQSRLQGRRTTTPGGAWLFARP